MRENPELFKPENSRDWKFAKVFSELVKPSSARAEEEKILILVRRDVRPRSWITKDGNG